MNINHLIVLLQVYRGTPQELREGTYESDLQWLLDEGLVEVHRDRLFVSPGTGLWIKEDILRGMT